jgi:hypothetical protein
MFTAYIMNYSTREGRWCISSPTPQENNPARANKFEKPMTFTSRLNSYAQNSGESVFGNLT